MKSIKRSIQLVSFSMMVAFAGIHFSAGEAKEFSDCYATAWEYSDSDSKDVLTFSMENNSSSEVPYSENISSTDCASGGTGSSGCSILYGICSVDCQDGYYACCSLVLGCHCVGEDDESEA